MATKKTLINEIDDEFGVDFETLEGCKRIKDQCENELKTLENEVLVKHLLVKV